MNSFGLIWPKQCSQLIRQQLLLNQNKTLKPTKKLIGREKTLMSSSTMYPVCTIHHGSMTTESTGRDGSSSFTGRRRKNFYTTNRTRQSVRRLSTTLHYGNTSGFCLSVKRKMIRLFTLSLNHHHHLGHSPDWSVAVSTSCLHHSWP